jgi:hypothetical protein
MRIYDAIFWKILFSIFKPVPIDVTYYKRIWWNRTSNFSTNLVTLSLFEWGTATKIRSSWNICNTALALTKLWIHLRSSSLRYKSLPPLVAVNCYEFRVTTLVQ